MPWLKDLTDACHEHGCAVMIQLTHLGRRTGWNKADWLPVVSPSHEREAAHRSFPKKLENWDIQRIQRDYVAAAQRMQAAGMGRHRVAGVWAFDGPVLVTAHQQPGRTLWRHAGKPLALWL